MPKLLNDVLSHLKDQKSVFVKVNESNQPSRNARLVGIRGVGLGVFGAMLTIAGLSYAALLSPDEIALVALGTALVSGGVVFIRSCFKITG